MTRPDHSPPPPGDSRRGLPFPRFRVLQSRHRHRRHHRTRSSRIPCADRSTRRALVGSDPRLRRFAEHSFRHRAEVGPGSGEERRQSATGRQQLPPCCLVQVAPVCQPFRPNAPLIIQRPLAPLPRLAQSPGVQVEHLDDPLHVLRRHAHGRARRRVCLDAPVVEHPQERWKRRQIPGFQGRRDHAGTLLLAAATVPSHGFQVPAAVAAAPSSALTTGDQVAVVERQRPPLHGVASWNDMLDLVVQIGQPDLAIAAKSVLEIRQFLEQVSMGAPPVMTPKPVPARALRFDFDIVPEPWRMPMQFPYALHVASPMSRNSFRRRISTSARPRAGSSGDSCWRSRLSARASSDSPWSSPIRRR